MVQESQKHLISQQKSLHECSHELEVKQRQLKEQVKEFESNQNVFVSIMQQHQRHLDSKMKMVARTFPWTPNQREAI